MHMAVMLYVRANMVGKLAQPRVIVDGVDGVETQPVNAIFVDPVDGVIREEVADFSAVEVYCGPHGVCVPSRKNERAYSCR